MEDAFTVLSQRIRGSGQRLLIAVDGRCASGKTTLAATLEEETGCNVVHMDDFFLRPEQRTPQRLAEPGGNVDYERFRQEVILPLSRGDQVRYQIFDCQQMVLSVFREIDPSKTTVIEGSYSCHPALWDFYDLRDPTAVIPFCGITMISVSFWILTRRSSSGASAAATGRKRR